MSNSEKARKLYEECDNANPVENTLMAWDYEGFQGLRGEIHYSMVAGIMINSYAVKEFKNDWIPLERETFYIQKWDKEGWTSTKNTIYKMKKKGFVETTLIDNKNYIRLTCDDLYNAEIYKTRHYKEEQNDLS